MRLQAADACVNVGPGSCTEEQMSNVAFVIRSIWIRSTCEINNHPKCESKQSNRKWKRHFVVYSPNPPKKVLTYPNFCSFPNFLSSVLMLPSLTSLFHHQLIKLHAQKGFIELFYTVYTDCDILVKTCQHTPMWKSFFIMHITN